MIHLLDVNVLIAVLDPRHSNHEHAHRWLGHGSARSWATCPITENAYVRITGSIKYANSLGSVAAARELLARNCAGEKHHFWPDDISLCEDSLWNEWTAAGAAHITDLYLLALAVKNKGRLASFDRRIPAHLVRGGKEALLILS